VHLDRRDTNGGCVEEEVERPKGSTEGITDAGHAYWPNGAHLAQHVGVICLEGDSDLLLPVLELSVGGIEVHEVVESEGGGGHSDEIEVVVLVPGGQEVITVPALHNAIVHERAISNVVPMVEAVAGDSKKEDGRPAALSTRS